MKKNFLWMMFGQGVFSAMLWLNMMLLARLGGAAEVGYYSFALSIVTPITLLSGLSLRTVYITNHSQNYHFGDYFVLRLLSIPLTLLVFAVWAWKDSSNPTQGWVIFSIGIAKLAENMSDIAYGLPHKNEKIDRLVRSMILRAISGTGLLGMVYFYTHNIVLACIAYASAWWLVFFFYDQNCTISLWRETWQQRFLTHKRNLYALLWLALPMGLTSCLGALANSAPRYFVEQFLGSEQLGYFSSMVYFVVVGLMIVNALGQTLRPRLSKVYTKKDFKTFWQLTTIASAVSIFMGLSFYLITEQFSASILTLFYGQDFAAYSQLFPLIALSSIPLYLGGMWGFALSGMGYYRTTLCISTLTVIFTVVGCWYWIPIYGLHGAVYGFSLLGITSLLNLLPMLWITYREKTQLAIQK